MVPDTILSPSERPHRKRCFHIAVVSLIKSYGERERERVFNKAIRRERQTDRQRQRQIETERVFNKVIRRERERE